MGGTVYKRCDECGRWVHRDESVLRRRPRKNDEDRIRSTTVTKCSTPETTSHHLPVPRRICLYCVEGFDRKQSQEFARLAATAAGIALGLRR